jgi:uncharacterized membrane protein
MTLRRMLNRYTDVSMLSDLGHKLGKQFNRLRGRAGERLEDATERAREFYEEQLRGRSRTSRASIISGTSCASMGVGAVLMYLFDPTLGKRRRHLLRDKLVSSVHQIGDCCDATARDFVNRGRGLLHSIQSRFGADDAPGYVIEDRVRSTLGRYVSHPKAVQVWSDGGHVTLCGEILEDELKPAIKASAGVKGVKSVRHSLLPHASRGHIPSLQGGSVRRGSAIDVAQENWSPTTRVMAGLAGATLVTWGASSRSAPSLIGGALGLGLLGRAVTNLPAKRLVGAGGGRRAIDTRKTINIDAPIDVVYGFWSNYENFPLFMRNVKEVRDHGDGISHWVVAGPAGLKVEWDAMLSDLEPNKCIAWKSVPGAMLANAGVVQFQENADGTTRVDVRLSYNPPGGAMGHAVAALFGSDPKSEMDEDLARMKTLIETGNFPRDAAQHLTDAGTTTSTR